MSGPIIRKYGFPNHEQIFGTRPPEHGVETPKNDAPADSKPGPETQAKAKVDPKPKTKGPGKPKG